jgi:hypothetical protein
LVDSGLRKYKDDVGYRHSGSFIDSFNEFIVRLSLAILSILAILAGCGRSEKPPRSIADISVPKACVDTAFQPTRIKQTDNADLFNHPWLKLQPGITTISARISQDLESIRHAYDQMALMRQDLTLPYRSYEEDCLAIIALLQQLQQPIDHLALALPDDKYSVLNIPDIEPTHNCPVAPYHIHKRIHWCDSHLGMPVYLDVRVFSLTGDDDQVSQILDWHRGCLQGHFDQYSASDCMVFIGHGDRTESSPDDTHGFGTKNRGLFLGCIALQDRLYVLHLDTSWETFEPEQANLTAVMNRSLVSTECSRTE